MNASTDTSFFGHPRGLSTLYFTEMWERFSYYGTRALLMLFMTAPLMSNGLGFDVPKAAAVYGLYTSLVYMLALPGGWLADRFLGQQNAVLWGGVLIAVGNASLVLPSVGTFYLGLALIACGTGLLKPNVSTIVGQIYPPNDARRDAGFSIFYMGINLGALLSPLICGSLAQKVNWRAGFAAASAGMVLGLIQYQLGRKNLGDAGRHAAKPESDEAAAVALRQSLLGIGGVLAVIALIAGLGLTGHVEITETLISTVYGWLLTVTIVAVFVWLLVFSRWTPEERKRLIAVLAFCVSSAVFWSVFEQAGSTLNLFAERNTDLHIMSFSFPAAWFQSVNSVFLFALAPVFAWLWLRLGNSNPSSPLKFTIGLFFVGLGFLVLIPAAASSGRVSPLWLTLTYLLHTIGELCLSPVGLSTMTKLAPVRIAGLVMGLWFLATSAGNYMGGRMSGLYESLALPRLFGAVGLFAIGAGVLLALMIRPINRWMGGVK
jgi:proton-dependent oligopeptide transporter, POT family